MTDLSKAIDALFEQQFSAWELAANNYRQLEGVRVKHLDYNGFSLAVQFNPARITSSAARVDTKSISERPCFLCSKNRPPQQEGVMFGDNYITLINPFPIFNRHLTIVNIEHTDQLIGGSFDTMLGLSASLPGYTVFYNGPQCGASAPDHLHFQAGNRGFLPIENDFAGKRLCRQIAGYGDCTVWLWEGYGRGIFTLTGKEKGALTMFFNRFYEEFAALQPERPEPMLNILSGFDSGEWTVHVIPRKQHRPDCFFAEGDCRILLSPASVDMGGVFITPREEDFLKLDTETAREILDQVCYSSGQVYSLLENII